MKKNPLLDILGRTSTDKAFREEFLRDPAGVLKRAGIHVPEGKTITVHENSDEHMYIVIPTSGEDQPAKWSREERPAPGEKKESHGLAIEWGEDALILKGRIDAVSAKDLRGEMERASGSLVIDLQEVDYMGSLGLSVLLEARKRLHANGKTLTLYNVPDEIKNVFALTNTDSLFYFVDPPDLLYFCPPHI